MIVVDSDEALPPHPATTPAAPLPSPQQQQRDPLVEVRRIQAERYAQQRGVPAEPNRIVYGLEAPPAAAAAMPAGAGAVRAVRVAVARRRHGMCRLALLMMSPTRCQPQFVLSAVPDIDDDALGRPWDEEEEEEENDGRGPLLPLLQPRRRAVRCSACNDVGHSKNSRKVRHRHPCALLTTRFIKIRCCCGFAALQCSLFDEEAARQRRERSAQRRQEQQRARTAEADRLKHEARYRGRPCLPCRSYPSRPESNRRWRCGFSRRPRRTVLTWPGSSS